MIRFRKSSASWQAHTICRSPIACRAAKTAESESVLVIPSTQEKGRNEPAWFRNRARRGHAEDPLPMIRRPDLPSTHGSVLVLLGSRPPAPASEAHER